MIVVRDRGTGDGDRDTGRVNRESEPGAVQAAQRNWAVLRLGRRLGGNATIAST